MPNPSAFVLFKAFPFLRTHILWQIEKWGIRIRESQRRTSSDHGFVEPIRPISLDFRVSIDLG